MFTKIDALVIKQFDIGEGDKILTLLSREGKISASAKGVKSLKSKNLSSTGLFCYSKFTLGGGGGKYYVNQAELIESFYELRLSVEKTAVACYFAEVCQFLSRENMENEALLSLMLNSLYMLSKKDRKLSYIKPVFELRALSVCGHTPNLLCCESCGKFEGEMFFYLREGVIVCGDCLSKTKKQGICLPVPSSVVSAMRYIIYSKSKEVFSFALSNENREILANVCEAYLITQLEYDFPTLRFYKTNFQNETP